MEDPVRLKAFGNVQVCATLQWDDLRAIAESVCHHGDEAVSGLCLRYWTDEIDKD